MNRKKNWLNRLKFWKNRPVRFLFYKQKTEKPNRTEQKKNGKKTEPNRKKPSQNRKNWENWAKPVWTSFCPKKPNQTETGRFDLVSVFFLKKFGLVIFLIKTKPNWKWSPLFQTHPNTNKAIMCMLTVYPKNNNANPERYNSTDQTLCLLPRDHQFESHKYQGH